MAADPVNRAAGTPPLRLTPFRAEWAGLVVSWVRDAQEAYWLAPKTPPPLTATHVLRWHEPGHNPFALLAAPGEPPVGYAELNTLVRTRRQYWIGHLIVDPDRRGRGLGSTFTQLLLDEAFEERGAQRVSLVVFPENAAASACYRAAGLREDGHEWHTFPAYGTRACLVRWARSRV
jgi:RimJ/RimL family protein N-acetyltransferase